MNTVMYNPRKPVSLPDLTLGAVETTKTNHRNVQRYPCIAISQLHGVTNTAKQQNEAEAKKPFP